MLGFRNTSILFIIVFVLLLTLIIINGISFVYLLFPIILYLIILFIGVTNITFDFYLPSIKKLKDNQQVLLSFDDGPDSMYTPLILDLLDQYQAKAMFFVIGKHVEKSKLLLKEIHDRGHIIGNHSWSHSNYFSIFRMDRMIKEVKQSNDMIEEIIKEKPIYFRPPFGITNPRIAKLVRKTGMKSVSWSFRSYDGANRPNEKIFSLLKKEIKGGEILLFHDNRAATYELLKEVIPWLKERFDLNVKSI